jgi:hypothetical protein
MCERMIWIDYCIKKRRSKTDILQHGVFIHQAVQFSFPLLIHNITYDHLDSTSPHSVRFGFHASREHARSTATASQSIPPGIDASIRDPSAFFLVIAVLGLDW